MRGNIEGLDHGFVQGLLRAERLAKMEFVVSSGRRSIVDNDRVGGVKESAHLDGLAADIVVSNSSDRFLVVKGLLDCGFDRIGIYSGHVHVDSAVGLARFVIW